MNNEGKSISEQIALELISVQPMTNAMTGLFENAKSTEELKREGYKPLSRIGLMWIKEEE